MRIKKKYNSGTAHVFISRKKALKKLQISLKDFRRLCIIKGIYPREPNHIKKANKGGSSQNKIYYHLRDVNFLAQEPLLKKYREYKIFLRKVNHARAKKDYFKAANLLKSKPTFNYDHIVKERYPTFSSALRDLDDALTMCFAFASLSQSSVARLRIINWCKKLTVEFMHYLIEARCLRKVFISIEGIHYQAEIMGERINWVVGHERSVGRAKEEDFTTMANFVDFYTSMLSFVNFRLFKSIGLFYPPQLPQQNKQENNEYIFGNTNYDDRVYSLAFPLKKTEKIDPDEATTIDDFFDDSNDDKDLAKELRNISTLKTLFSKCKFFLNREVPKESLALIIRSCGGFVCWEGCSPNSIFESNEVLTHQIVDRPVEKANFNRVYVQPQWVFDCFNARCLLPTVRYAPGAILPPHFSPFVEDVQAITKDEYVPIEQIQQYKQERSNDIGAIIKSDENNTEKNKKKSKELPVKTMRVQKSKVFRESEQMKINEQGHNLKLREMMIPKKRKRVYEKIKRGIKNKENQVSKIKKKMMLDEEHSR